MGEVAPRRLRGGSREAPSDQCSFGWPSLLHSSYYVASNEVTEDLTRRWARGPANLRICRSRAGYTECQESCLLCMHRGVGWWWSRVGQSHGEFRYAVATGSFAVATHNQVIRK